MTQHAPSATSGNIIELCPDLAASRITQIDPVAEYLEYIMKFFTDRISARNPNQESA